LPISGRSSSSDARVSPVARSAAASAALANGAIREDRTRSEVDGLRSTSHDPWANRRSATTASHDGCTSNRAPMSQPSRNAAVTTAGSVPCSFSS
jgi:hypothetical protein